MKTVDFCNKQTFVASESLVLEAKEKNSNFYLNFSYTSYGGSFFDKVVIDYFKQNHPESIVYEETSWNGENAFIFGDVSKVFAEETDKYLLGFEEIEDYYFAMKVAITSKDAEMFYNDNKELFVVDEITAINAIYDYLEECDIDINRVDFCESSLIEHLREIDIISDIN